MKLSNFEEYIDEVILFRGKDYFVRGLVEKIEEKEKGHFMVKVSGSDDYTVDIYLHGSNEIINTYCNCPYDLGEFCKHEAAALLSLREMLNLEGIEFKEKPASLNNKKIELMKIVSDLKKDELIKIILELADQNPEIEKKLMFSYAPAEDEIAASKKLIREYIQRNKRGGFIEWNRVDNALQGAYMTLEKAHDKIEREETESAVLLGISVLSIVVDMLQYCDDSSGNVGDVIHDSINIMDESVSLGIFSLSTPQLETLFAVIMKEALHKRYDDWNDLRVELFQICIHFCGNPKLRKRLESQIEKMFDSKDVRQYYVEEMKLLQLELFQRFDGEEKALTFIDENLQYSAFREKAIDYLMEKEEYDEVIRLCENGEKSDQAYRGIVDKWKKYKLQAYEAMGDLEAQKGLLLEFIFKNEYESYEKLKRLYREDAWQPVLEDILKRFEKESYLPNVYVSIIQAEKLNNKLLEYCEKNPKMMENHYSELIDEYPDEVNNIFKDYIQKSSEQSSNRKQYKQVCKLLNIYLKAYGEEAVFIITDKLKQMYLRRPAFVDELEKLESKLIKKNKKK